MTSAARVPMLPTKLAPPPRREGLVARPQLVRRLDASAPAPLGVVSAPAGWGKTTLLAEWARRADAAVGWVSLEPADNDPVRFWGYATAALRGAGVAADAMPLALDAGDGHAEFLADVAAAERPVALVLDDYHLVTDATIHRALELVLDHAPLNLRVVVGTRTEPPLGLARRRVRGQLVELRTADLRMDAGQAASLVRAAADSALDDDAMAALHRRTEGWAAGLYLAALSLRGRVDVAGFVDAFAGDDRLVVDYLAAEVLGALPPRHRRFLLHTSILGRLSGPLCDAVTGGGDSARMLAELEDSNLFLVPLDNRRGWYRFHHLFGELLRHELSLAEDEQAVAALHTRAAGWLRANGHADEAIHHLAAAGDLAGAAEVVAVNWRSYHSHGWLATIERWLALLPEATVLGDARLCLAAAWTAINVGRHDIAAGWIDAAEHAVGDGPATRQVAAGIAMARSIERMSMGDTAAAVAAGRTGMDLEDDADSQWRAVACLALGMAQHHAMEVDAAYATLGEAVEVGERTGIPIPALVALCVMADIDIVRGDLAAAEHHARRALRHADAERHARFPHAAGAHSSMALVYAAHGRVDDARAAAERGVELASRGRMGPQIAHALMSRARVRAADGDHEGAQVDLAAARTALLRDGGRLPARLAQRLGDIESLTAAPRTTEAHRGPSPGDALTPRERTVLGMLAGSGSLREIASELSVSPNTVKTQVRAVYRKLGVSDRTQAVEEARRRGISRR